MNLKGTLKSATLEGNNSGSEQLEGRASTKEETREIMGHYSVDQLRAVWAAEGKVREFKKKHVWTLLKCKEPQLYEGQSVTIDCIENAIPKTEDENLASSKTYS